MKLAQIGPVALTPERPFVIAEAGVNHEGSLARAIEMVDAAADAGADMIKFQSYKAGRLASVHSPAYWDRTAEPAESQYALFQRYDALDVVDYEKLAERCEARGILFSTTPFDLDFLDALDPLLVCHKVASADITNRPLLERVGAKGKPVLLSTGASTLGEAEAALGWLEAAGAPAVALLHCVLQYPTEPANASLGAIRHLAQVFPDCTIGWSDHVPPEDACLALYLAWLEGAQILEKHFTLDKSLPGNDHYHAMDPDDLRAFRTRCERTALLRGEARKRVLPCEEPARVQARRSLVLNEALTAGDVLRERQLVPKRPGHGISPADLDRVVGRRLAVDRPADHVLSWDDLMPPATPSDLEED
ncbi:MAG: N-acetylneuraminate synthase family protein [Myxococcota bacterium]